MQIKSYDAAVRYLEGFIGKIVFKVDPEYLKHHDPLGRMRVLLDLLGNPQEKLKSVLIGGTSGKGSTAYLVSHILTTAGYKTGLTISPHLQKISERLQINGKSISDEKFTEMVGSIVDTIELMKKMAVGAPSYFEILIAMAFLYFAKEKVDITVVEVGMGGEFDATNTLYPLIAVLTNVTLDHTNVLGGTVQKIARTKAGIIKKVQSSKFKVQSLRQQIVVTGVKQPSVVKIVEDRCREVGAKLYRLHKDFDCKIKKEGLGGSVFDLTTTHDRVLQLNDLNVALLGRHQVENTSLAIETVLQLGQFGFRVYEENIRQALKTAFFPGRFEVVEVNSILRRASLAQDKTSSALVLDGAHNPTKMKAFLTTLKDLFPKERKIFVVGFKFDKDVKTMLKQILQVADGIIITEFKAKTDVSNNASADASNLKSQISNLKYDRKIKVILTKNSETAIKKAFQIAKTQKDTLIIVTGSLYLVGEIREYLFEIASPDKSGSQ